MRRVGGMALIALGFFLIFLAPLVRFYAYPRVLKIPPDQYTVSRAFGNGSYLAPVQGKLIGPRPLINISTTRGDVKASSTDRVVLDQFSVTKDRTDGNVINASNERFVLDRTTGLPIHCCGERPRHDGYTLKLPFGTKKTTYMFWDSTARKPFPMRYSGETVIDGLTAYVFKQRVPPTSIQTLFVSGKSAGIPDATTVPISLQYTADTEIQVEPLTGAVLKASQHNRQALVRPDGSTLQTVADVTFSYSFESVKTNVDEYKTKVGQLRLVGLQLPVFGPVLGILLVVVGWLLLRSDDRRRSAGEPSAEPAERAA